MREVNKKNEVAIAAKLLNELNSERVKAEKTMSQLLSDSTARMEKGAEWFPYQISQIGFEKQRFLRLDKDIVSAQDLLERRHYELNRIIMRRKALESLREKREKDFRLQQSRKDQKEIDEMFQLSKLRER